MERKTPGLCEKDFKSKWDLGKREDMVVSFALTVAAAKCYTLPCRHLPLSYCQKAVGLCGQTRARKAEYRLKMRDMRENKQKI